MCLVEIPFFKVKGKTHSHFWKTTKLFKLSQIEPVQSSVLCIIFYILFFIKFQTQPTNLVLIKWTNFCGLKNTRHITENTDKNTKKPPKIGQKSSRMSYQASPQKTTVQLWALKTLKLHKQHTLPKFLLIKNA